LGGLTFVAFLVVQNAQRAKAPSFDATPAKVTAYFVDHRAAVLVPLGLFPVGMLALFAFVAASWSRIRDQGGWLANLGVLGATAIAAMFGLVNVAEIVLAAKAMQLAQSPAVIQALGRPALRHSALTWPPSR
jgi:hypothetical protein